MQKATLDKLRRYIDLTAAPLLALQEELDEAWQEFVEAFEADQEEQSRQELVEAALADPEWLLEMQMDVAVALRRALENLIDRGQE